MTHEQADDLLASAALGGIEPEEMHALKGHLADCPACRLAARQYQAVVSVLPLAVDTVEPSPHLRNRLMAAIYAEAARAPRPAPQRSLLQRFYDRLPSGRAFTAGSMVVATGLAAVLIWTATTAPTVKHLTSHGTTAQPQAQADLYLDGKNHTVQLQARTLLPPPAGGAVYEVWLIKAGGTPQPTAYLQAQPDGSFSTTINGDMSGYSTLATTLEDKPGNPVPRGTEVFSIALGSS